MDLKLLEDNLYTWQEQLNRRGAEVDLKKVLEVYQRYLEVLQKAEGLRAERNVAAKAQDIEAGKRIGSELKELEDEVMAARTELDELVADIPNLPDKDIPDGGEENGKVIGVGGKPRDITNPRDHIALGESLGILDI